MNLSKQSNLVLVVVLCATLGVMVNTSRGNSSPAPEASAIQELSSLDRRLSLLEQRFYNVESSISRLQQYIAAQRPSVPPPSAGPSISDREISVMREEIQRLNLRIGEIECGLIKLDERTTPATRKNATAKANDPCRLTSDAPVRLSTRP